MDKRVTFVKIMGILFLLCSIFILVASMAIGPSLNTFTGLLLLLISILYLVSPAIVYNEKEIQLKNLIGITVKKHSFATDKITIENDTIVSNGKKLRVAKSMLVKSEYQALLDHVRRLSKDENDFEVKEPTSKLKEEDTILDSGF